MKEKKYEKGAHLNGWRWKTSSEEKIIQGRKDGIGRSGEKVKVKVLQTITVLLHQARIVIRHARDGGVRFDKGTLDDLTLIKNPGILDRILQGRRRSRG